MTYQTFYQNNSELAASILKFSDISYLLPLMYTEIRMHSMTYGLENVLELGVRTGESTVALYSAVSEVNRDLKLKATLTSVDIDPTCESVVSNKLKNINTKCEWNFYAKDSLKFPWQKPIDFLLIDSSHEEEQTLEELKKYSPFVKSNGTIWLHDTRSTVEVPNAIKRWRSENKNWNYYETPTYAGLGWLTRK